MRAHGFTTEMLVELVRAGLASAQTERVVAGGRVVEVARVRITAAGRRALAASVDKGAGQLLEPASANYDFARHVRGVILIDYLCHAGQKQLVDVDIAWDIAKPFQHTGDSTYFRLRNVSGRFEEFAFPKKVVTLCNLVWLQVATGNKDIDRFVTVAVVSEPVHSLVEGGEKPRQGGHVASRPVAIHHGAILWQVSDVIRGPSNDAEAGGGAIEVEWRRQYCGIHRA